MAGLLSDDLMGALQQPALEKRRRRGGAANSRSGAFFTKI